MPFLVVPKSNPIQAVRIRFRIDPATLLSISENSTSLPRASVNDFRMAANSAATLGTSACRRPGPEQRSGPVGPARVLIQQTQPAGN